MSDQKDSAFQAESTSEGDEQSSNLTLPHAQETFVKIVRELASSDKKLFLDWVKWNWMNEQADANSEDLPDEVLKMIAAEIRDNLPPDAILPSENIRNAAMGEGLNCDANHSLHVDSFLYDDEAVDLLGDTGKLDRNYCLQCGSHKTRPIDFISHSLSREQLLYVFTALLPPLNPNHVVLDVGSRLGAVLYAAQLYTKAGKIIGIEMNRDFCQLQRGVIKKYCFQDRIEIVEGNIFHRSDVIQASDVIIMNNVFECFMTPEEQVEIWKFLRYTIKKGTLLVTNPPIDVVFAIRQTGIDLNEWLEEQPVYNQDAPGISDTSQVSDLKLYKVL